MEVVSDYINKIGLDLSKDVSYWLKKQGLTLWKNHSQVIQLPEVELFAGLKVKFHTNPNEVLNLPTEFVSGYVYLGNDNRKTYDVVLKGLTAVLGAPEEVSSSNTLSHLWKDDNVAIKITTWPLDLNARTKGSNVIIDKDPNYAFETHIDVSQKSAVMKITEQEYSYYTSDAKAFDLKDISIQFTEYVPSHQYRYVFKKNPQVADKIVFFNKPDVLGYIGPHFSFVVNKTSSTQLVHTRLLPARGSGYSIISVICDTGGTENQFIALRGEKPSSCDELVKKLAAYWGLNIQEEEYLDD